MVCSSFAGLLLTVAGIEEFDSNVLELDFLRRSAVPLGCEDTGEILLFRLVIDDFRHEAFVDFQRDLRPAADQVIFVPRCAR